MVDSFGRVNQRGIVLLKNIILGSYDRAALKDIFQSALDRDFDAEVADDPFSEQVSYLLEKLQKEGSLDSLLQALVDGRPLKPQMAAEFRQAITQANDATGNLKGNIDGSTYKTSIFDFFRARDNREVMGFFGSALGALAAAAWGIFVYIGPNPPPASAPPQAPIVVPAPAAASPSPEPDLPNKQEVVSTDQVLQNCTSSGILGMQLPPGFGETMPTNPVGLNLLLVSNVQSGNLICVDKLLSIGASPNVVGSTMGDQTDELTPLMAAIQEKNLPIVAKLLDSGANPNLRSMARPPGNPGRSPLAAAALFSPEIAMLLLDRNADVNQPTTDNFSPLHVAAMKGNVDLVKAFLAKGAKTDLKDDRGRTPLDLAKVNTQPAVIPLLESSN